MNTRTLLRTTAIAYATGLLAVAPAHAHDSGDDAGGGEKNPVEALVCSVDATHEGCAPAEEPAPSAVR